MGTKPDVTPEEAIEIARLYQVEMMGIEAIATHMGRSTDTIWRKLKRQGVPLRQRERPVPCTDEDLARMYTDDLMDSEEIANKFGVSSSFIAKRLRSNGVKMRSPGSQGAKLRSGEWGIHGLSRHPLYQVWSAMNQRCHTPTNKRWDDYGGSGVSVCERWRKRPEGFANFLEDMGERPPGTSLDRIDPFGNYEPSNCRWATREVQDQNKRGSKENIQRMMDEIKMWKERALRAEGLLAELSCHGKGARRRLTASQDHLGQPEGRLLAVPLFQLDADCTPAEVPCGDESAA